MAHSGKKMTFATDLVPQEDDLYYLGKTGQTWKIFGTLTGNADTATTATNLENKPSIQTSDTTKITITAGEKTSEAYTVPYSTTVGTAEDTTNTLYVIGVTSNATTTLKRDTSITIKGNTITAVTFNSTAASLTSATSTTANQVATATLTLGNSANVNSTTAHSEGQIILYSASTAAHTIKGVSTTTAYTHTLPNNTGLLVSLSGGTAKGSTTKPIYVPNTGIVTECDTYAGGTAVTLNDTSKAASTASFYAPTSAGTAGQVLISTAATPAWYGGTIMTGTAAADWKTAFKGTTDASSSVAGAVTIAGGLAIGKSMVVGSTATVTTETRSPKFTLTVSDSDKAYLRYNSTDDSIDFIFA